jgi:peptidyl-prolyl cis-trans isomerase C
VTLVSRIPAVPRFVTGAFRLPRTGSRWLVLGVVALALVAAGSTTELVIQRLTALPSDAVFRMDGELMTQQQYQQRLHLLGAVYGVQEPTDAAAKDTFLRTAAKAVAVDDLVDRAAQQQGIVISDSTARGQLNTVIAQTSGGENAFVAQLGAVGLSEADVLSEIKRTMASSQLYTKITAKVPVVSGQAAQQYYSAHTAAMAAPESRHLLNIVVSSKQTAQNVLNQAKAGTSFATLAAQNSLDASTKDKGGDLGSVTAVALDQNYAAVAFAAAQGGFFGPVQTQYGWNVGQVVGITPANPRTFTQVETELKAEMQTSAKLKVWSTWLADTIKSANVEYASQYAPTNPDSPPADLTQQQ